jgi:hypothetical protein
MGISSMIRKYWDFEWQFYTAFTVGNVIWRNEIEE